MIHGINNPWKLPSYRFGALLVSFLKFDKTPEGVQEIENALSSSDSLAHPLLDSNFRNILKAMCRALSTSRVRTSTDNVIYDHRLMPEIPIEERKKQEARAKGKAFRVPEWWAGEKANYQVAKQMMVKLPKKAGKPVI